MAVVGPSQLEYSGVFSFHKHKGGGGGGGDGGGDDAH